MWNFKIFMLFILKISKFHYTSRFATLFLFWNKFNEKKNELTTYAFKLVESRKYKNLTRLNKTLANAFLNTQNKSQVKRKPLN